MLFLTCAESTTLFVPKMSLGCAIAAAKLHRGNEISQIYNALVVKQPSHLPGDIESDIHQLVLFHPERNKRTFVDSYCSNVRILEEVIIATLLISVNNTTDRMIR